MSRKVGQIIARGERRWLVRVYLGRDRETRKRTYHNRMIYGSLRYAQAYLTRRLHERDLSRGVEGLQCTVDEFLDHWLKTAVEPKVRGKTYSDYAAMLRRYIRPAIGTRILASLSPLEIQSAYQIMIDRKLSARTVRYTHAVLRAAIRQAIRWQLLLSDPTQGVQIPSPRCREMSVLNTDQARSFLRAAAHSPHECLFALALTTGMRPSEYLALCWRDIDWDRGTVSVVRSLHRHDGQWTFTDTKRARSRRIVKLQTWVSPAKAPAAYLLVAVDLLLSHWPKSRSAAIPFLGCPELLCSDRQRMTSDNIEPPDFLGLKALQKEPVGFADLASLKARPSRRLMLDRLLQEYVFDEENRKLVVERLQQAAARLGPPKGKSGLLDPAFMTVHALNLLDLENWQKRSLQTKDGRAEGWEYVSPASESERFQSLQDEKFRERQARETMQIQIRAALNDLSLSPPGFAASAVEWAQSTQAKPQGKDEDRDGMHRDTIVIAALVGLRDGGAVLVEKHGDWMRETFLDALRTKKDPVWDIQTGLQFNPIALGFVGMVLMLKNRFEMEDVRSLLQAAGDESPAAAHGFALTVGVLAEIDERLVRSVLRCAFAACVQPRPQWRLEETEAAARSKKYVEKVQNAIEAELAWLSGKRDEPAWPPFAEDRPNRRDRYVTVRGRRKELVERPPEREVRTDYHSAALWLKGATVVFDVAKRPCLRDVVNAYASWTRIMNGSGLDEEDELESPPREWNVAYFKLLAYCLPGLTSAQIDEIALMPIMDSEERAFHEITATFLPDADILYFTELTLKEEQAVHIRSILAKKLMTGRMWKYHARDRSTSTEIHLGPAVAALLFNDYANLAPPKCYLLPQAIERLDPFLPTLKDLAESGTFLLAAIVLLNLLEVQPRTAHLPLIVAASKSWLATFPEDKAFWIDQGVGRRLCALIDAVLTLDPRLFVADHASRGDIDRLLENLVRLGIAEAYQLEDKLRALQ